MAAARTHGARALDLLVQRRLWRAKIAEAPQDDSVREAYQLATKLGITGTPSYVLGDEAVFGAVGESELNQKIASIRQCGKTTC